MRSIIQALLLVACLASPTLAAEPTHAIEKHDSKRVKATLAFTLETPELDAAEWVVFTPSLPILPCQRAVKSQLTPDGVPDLDLSDRRRPILTARIPTKGKPALEHRLQGEAIFETTLVARKLVVREPGRNYGLADDLNEGGRKRNLSPTPTIDFEAEGFTDWLKKESLYRRQDESELDFARRVFLTIKKSFTYQFHLEMDRHPAHVCEVGKSDCGGLSILYVAVMRANGLPARVLAGCWAKSTQPDKLVDGVLYHQVHVKAEVFLTDIGWLPIDLASAVSHDKTAEGLYFFGNDPGDFITLHVDPDIKVDSIHFGEKTFTWLQQYHYFVIGKGKLTNTKQTLRWTVERGASLNDE